MVEFTSGIDPRFITFKNSYFITFSNAFDCGSVPTISTFQGRSGDVIQLAFPEEPVILSPILVILSGCSCLV